MDRLSRFQGCLLGVAIGDALGMPFQYAGDPGDIEWKVQGDLDFLPGDLRAGQWTDDTQMTLCIVESLLERNAVDGAHIASRYLAWYRSADRRSPGTTTLEALGRLDHGIPWNLAGMRGNNAAGNGAAMRISPIGLWHACNVSGLLEDVEAATISTHNTDEAVRGAAAVAFAVARAAAGTLDPGTIVRETCDFIGPCRSAVRLGEAEKLHRAGTDWRAALARIGTGRYIVETVGAAFFCLLSAPDDYARGVSMAVRAGGDADTTAAVAGAMIGANVGLQGIPDRWVEGVEDGPRIAGLARQLCGLVYG